MRNRSTEPVSGLNFASISRFIPNVRFAAVRMACSNALIRTDLSMFLSRPTCSRTMSSLASMAFPLIVTAGLHRLFVLGLLAGTVARLDRLRRLVAAPDAASALHHCVPIRDELGVIDIGDRQLERLAVDLDLDALVGHTAQDAAEVPPLTGRGVEWNLELDLRLASGEVREVC